MTRGYVNDIIKGLNIMKLLGLKTVRNIFGLTMRDLARELSVSANAINIWENGGSEVSGNRLEELSNLFGISKELLIKENHSDKELIIIEFSRFNYKLYKYQNLSDDKEVIDLIYNNVVKNIKKKMKNLSQKLII